MFQRIFLIDDILLLSTYSTTECPQKEKEKVGN